MGVIKAIASVIFGGALKYILTVALIATAAWGWWNYKLYRDVSDELGQYKDQVEALEEERDRQDRRLMHFGEIVSDRERRAAEQEERKAAWQAEALKWKNRMAELKQENSDVAEWADNNYPAELD